MPSCNVKMVPDRVKIEDQTEQGQGFLSLSDNGFAVLYGELGKRQSDLPFLETTVCKHALAK